MICFVRARGSISCGLAEIAQASARQQRIPFQASQLSDRSQPFAFSNFAVSPPRSKLRYPSSALFFLLSELRPNRILAGISVVTTTNKKLCSRRTLVTAFMLRLLGPHWGCPTSDGREPTRKGDRRIPRGRAHASARRRLSDNVKLTRCNESRGFGAKDELGMLDSSATIRDSDLPEVHDCCSYRYRRLFSFEERSSLSGQGVLELPFFDSSFSPDTTSRLSAKHNLPRLTLPTSITLYLIPCSHSLYFSLRHTSALPARLGLNRCGESTLSTSLATVSGWIYLV